MLAFQWPQGEGTAPFPTFWTGTIGHLGFKKPFGRDYSFGIGEGQTNAPFGIPAGIYFETKGAVRTPAERRAKNRFSARILAAATVKAGGPGNLSWSQPRIGVHPPGGPLGKPPRAFLLSGGSWFQVPPGDEFCGGPLAPGKRLRTARPGRSFPLADLVSGSPALGRQKGLRAFFPFFDFPPECFSHCVGGGQHSFSGESRPGPGFSPRRWAAPGLFYPSLRVGGHLGGARPLPRISGPDYGLWEPWSCRPYV